MLHSIHAFQGLHSTLNYQISLKSARNEVGRSLVIKLVLKVMASWIFRPGYHASGERCLIAIHGDIRFISWAFYATGKSMNFFFLLFKQSTGNNKTEDWKFANVSLMENAQQRVILATRRSVGDNASFIIAFSTWRVEIKSFWNVFWVVGNPLEPRFHSQTLNCGLKILSEVPIERSSVSEASLFINKAEELHEKAAVSKPVT